MLVFELTILTLAGIGAVSAGKFVGRQLVWIKDRFRKHESWSDVQRRVLEASTESLDLECHSVHEL